MLTKNLNVRLTQFEAEALDTQAQKLGITRSDFIRYLLNTQTRNDKD